MGFYIGFAGQTFFIEPHNEKLRDFCLGFEREPDESAFDASVTDTEIAAESPGNVKVRSSYMLESLAVYRKIAEYLPYKNSFLFHGSALAVNNEAYVFAAESGVGKSTHTQLYRQVFGDRVTMINDDKPVLTCVDGKVYVSGTPWNGKHRLSADITAPIKAICFLRRGEQNRISKADKDGIFEKLWAHTYKPADKQSLINTVRLISDITHATEFYTLECNMEPEAAVISYNGMKGSTKNVT